MQIVILLVIFFIQVYFQYTFVQYVQMFFMLGVINDFIDVWSQNVYSCNGFIVFVKVYIECFNIFWIVFNYYWCFKVFFCQIMFMFRREIDFLVNWVFKFFVVVFENGYCVGIIYLCKIGFNEVFQM